MRFGCCMHEVDDKCIKDFNAKTWNRKETTWETRLKGIGHVDVD
jgi:hypothetical protein